MKSAVFWFVTPCSLERARRSWLQDKLDWLLAKLTLLHVPPKRRALSELHGVAYEKTVPFIVAAVRAST
jgi:putative effector of murein hydrolase LrgA (UPF0299 family)